MNKKLIAVAVAGALAAPAVSMAQSNVQVFGDLYVEYSFWNPGRNAAGTVQPASVDFLQTPGSQIGFKGEENLGGGMSAWFTCTSTADFRGVSADGWCTRNSAVGMKGGFGNVYVGVWDTPMKRAAINVGGRDTGVFGTAFLLFGNSTTTDQGGNAGVFKRRQRNLITYDSPDFGGFSVQGAFSSTNNSTNITTTAANAKPRIWSLAASYKAGPMELTAAYEKHTKAYGTATFDGDEEGYQLAGSYQLGSVKLGALYTEQKADTAVATEAKVKAYHLGAEWKLAGPHNLHFGYTQAGDMKGTTNAAMGSRPVVAAAGDTGAKLYQVRYLYDFSKRTTGTVGYVNLKNDTNAGYDLGGLSGTGNGAKSSAIALSLSHKF